MKHLFVILFLGLSFLSTAQVVERNGKKYVVKKGKIYHEKMDVTSTFSLEEQLQIKEEFSKLLEEIRLKEKEETRLKDIEKKQKKAEKDKKRAENKQKKAEKELKRKQKAQSNYEKASKDFSKNQSKYKRLKERGKLSPDDEAKWLKKLEKLKDKVNKAEKKLKHA